MQSLSNMKTGVVILSLIAVIFGVDTILDANNIPTISEWFFNWLHTGLEAQLIFVGAIALFTAHVWWFGTRKD